LPRFARNDKYVSCIVIAKRLYSEEILVFFRQELPVLSPAGTIGFPAP
jgi:hypothetical protein